MVDSKRYLMIVNTFSSSRPWRIQFGRFHYFHPRSAAGKSDKSWAKRYTRRFVKTQKKHFCWKTELVKTIPLCGNQSTSILTPRIGLFQRWANSVFGTEYEYEYYSVRIFERIRIRILFVFFIMTEYEYEYYSCSEIWPNTNTNIIRSTTFDRIRIRILRLFE